jgi:CubicO group peptidase (beta-lactamase class C family)
MTKIMTSIAVLQLVEDNKISLADPIENFIPEFKNLTVIESFNTKDGTFTARPAKNKITLKHLLTHSSGLTYGSYDDIPSHSEIYSKAGIIELFTTDSISQSENVKKLASLPLLFEPGESFKYGLNIDVVGHLIEIISGKSLSDYFKINFFDPLEMRDTYFYIPESKKKRLVPIQTNIDGFWKIYDAEKYDVDFPLKGKEFFSGGAGLSSTVISFSKFLQMICDGGVYKNKRIVSSNIIESLKENHVEHLVDNLSHGLASGITTDLDIKMGFTGNIGSIYWDGMFSTSFFVDPSENLVFLVFRQLQDTEDETHLISEDIRALIQS